MSGVFEFGEAGNVFADDVEFEVDAVADFNVAEVGVFESVGYYCRRSG